MLKTNLLSMSMKMIFLTPSLMSLVIPVFPHLLWNPVDVDLEPSSTQSCESRRSRSRRSNSPPAGKQLQLLVAKTVHLKQQLSEMNLFNAKLLYVNKLMQNRNVSSKQQRAIVEAFR